MEIIKCKMCGAGLKIVSGSNIAECEYCGTVQKIVGIAEEKKPTPFSREQHFTKTAGIYEGNKPFVFISYSHKDTPFVMEIIQALDARNIRLWYDAGIEAGSEWPEYIANHLTSCACVLCFISRNYADSDNCRRELTFSLNLKKPTLSLYMEQFQMSGGLQLQLGLVQAMFCDRFPSADALADSLVTVPMIAACCTNDSNIVKEEYVRPAEPAPAQQNASPTVTAFLKRATMALEDGEWDRADAFCEQVLNIDPENAQAYLGKLLAELQVKNQEALKDCADLFDSNNNYKKAIRFGDDNLKSELTGYITHIIEDRTKRVEQERLAAAKRTGEERLAAAKRAEEERLARQKRAEEERLAQQKRAEEERLESFKQLRLAAAKRAEEMRLAQQKREEKKRLAEQQRKRVEGWRAQGLCQHCGGELKGLFSKKCVSCGRPKDY